VVHALASEHVVPSGAVGVEHVPVLGLHVPGRWHWSKAVQTTGVPVQVPAWHVSPVVHALPSMHGVPLARAGFEHVPVMGSQMPAA
jgi:hypothetical protein